MKIIQLATLLFLSFTLGGYAQKNKTRDTDKALSILLSDYNKTVSINDVSIKNFTAYVSKKKLSAKGMTIKKVKQLTYFTNKKEKRSIYLIQRIKGMSFSGHLANFNIVIFNANNEVQNDDEEIICEIIFNICKIGNCEVSCIVSDSCTGDGSSNPSCCDDVTCDDNNNNIRGDLSTPLETLMR